VKSWNPPPLPEGDDANRDYQKSCATALRLLARREHSELELRHKLAGRRFGDELIDTVVAELAAQGLLSDRRFAEAYVRGRFERGFGPQRIQSELRERGVATDLVAETLAELSGTWVDSARLQRNKRFGAGLPEDARERARQMRFLQQRGFTGDQIRAVFRL
jgi:regulatory protein